MAGWITFDVNKSRFSSKGNACSIAICRKDEGAIIGMGIQ